MESIILIKPINLNKDLVKRAALELQKRHKKDIDNHALNLESLVDFINEKSTQLSEQTIEKLNQDFIQITKQIKKEQQVTYSFFEQKIKNDIVEVNAKIEHAIQDLYNAKLSRTLNNIKSKEDNHLRFEKNIFTMELKIPYDNEIMNFKFKFSYVRDSGCLFNLVEKKLQSNLIGNYHFCNIYNNDENLKIVFDSIIKTKTFSIIVDNLILISDIKKTNHYDSLTFLKEFLSGTSIQKGSVKSLIPEIKDNAMLFNDVTIKDPKKKKTTDTAFEEYKKNVKKY